MKRLSQAQIRAIWAQNKKKGLRAVINKLRARGHRASDYRTVYHSTHKKFLPAIKKHGLLSPEDIRGFSTQDQYREPVYTGRRWYASYIGRNHPDFRRLKLRMPKGSELPSSGPFGDSLWTEYHYDYIPPSAIRKIERIRRKRNR